MWYPPCRPSCLLGAVVSVMRAMWAVVVPPLVPSGGSFLILCLLAAAAVCLDAIAPVISSLHLIARAWLRAVLPLRSSARASPLLRPVIDVDACAAAASWRLAVRPASSTRRAGRYDGAAAALSALLACPSARHPISAVRHRMATGLNACPVRLSLPVPAPCSSSASPATRSLAQSDFLAVLPPCRPITSSPSLPDQSIRGTGRTTVIVFFLRRAEFRLAASLRYRVSYI